MMFSLASSCNPDAFKRENLNASLQSCRELILKISLAGMISKEREMKLIIQLSMPNGNTLAITSPLAEKIPVKPGS